MKYGNPLKTTNGFYEVSNLGKVKSLNYNRKGIEKELSFGKGKGNYLYVTLFKEGKAKRKYIHRLVAEAFIVNNKKLPCVNHINGNKSDNNIDNLEWVTHKENSQWALKTGRFDNMKILNSKRMKEREVWKGRWCKNA